MSKAFYAASAPMFAVMLNNMNLWLDKAEAHAKAKGFEVGNLLASRLAPDMLSLTGQFQLATAFAKNAMSRISGQTPPNFEDVETNVPELRARIARALDIVQSIGEGDVDPERMVTFNIGREQTATVTASDYLYKFALPNFYFHCTAAYAILRHNGVELGKKDFLAGTMPS